jgi:hypothetical protein
MKKSLLLSYVGKYVTVYFEPRYNFRSLTGILGYADGTAHRYDWQYRKGFFHCDDTIFRGSLVSRVKLHDYTV